MSHNTTLNHPVDLKSKLLQEIRFTVPYTCMYYIHIELANETLVIYCSESDYFTGETDNIAQGDGAWPEGLSP